MYNRSMTKTCTNCGQTKPLEDFHRNKNTKDGRAYSCKPCMNQAVGRRHKDPVYRERQETQAAKKTKANREFLWKYLTEHPCEHCGNSDPRVLEFDHIDQNTKTADISYLVYRSPLERIQEEIAKCRVLCANCHRIRTAHQLGYWWTKLDTV